MDIKADVHIHMHSPQVETLLREVLAKLGLIIGNQETIMATVAENLAAAEAAAKANSDAEDSMIGILNAVRSEVAALKAAGTDPATAARIEALATALAARTPVLAAAAVAGTSAA